MSRDAARREARRAITATGLHRETWARKVAKVDPKTVATFLEGSTWPQAPTRKKIEEALGWPVGSLEEIADGQFVPEVHPFDQKPDSDSIEKWHIAGVARHMAATDTLGFSDERVLELAVYPLTDEALEDVSSAVLAALGQRLTRELDRVLAELRRRAERDEEIPAHGGYHLAARTVTPEFSARQQQDAERDRLAGIDPPGPDEGA